MEFPVVFQNEDWTIEVYLSNKTIVANGKGKRKYHGHIEEDGEIKANSNRDFEGLVKAVQSIQLNTSII